MNPEQLRSAISDTFDGRDFARMKYLTLWWLHGFINVFTERLRPLLPWEVTLPGTHRLPFRIVMRRRPLGYWVAHWVGVPAVLLLLALLGNLSAFVLTAVLAGFGVDVLF